MQLPAGILTCASRCQARDTLSAVLHRVSFRQVWVVGWNVSVVKQHSSDAAQFGTASGRR